MRMRRRGMSLVEVMVVLWGATTLLAMIAVLFHGALRATGARGDRDSRSAHWIELAERFRADVRSASRLGADATQERVELVLPDGAVIVYRVAEARLVVTGKDRDGKIDAQETIVLPPDGDARLRTDSERNLVILTIGRRLGAEPKGARREYRMVAALGADRRFDDKEQD